MPQPVGKAGVASAGPGRGCKNKPYDNNFVNMTGGSLYSGTGISLCIVNADFQNYLTTNIAFSL